MKEKLALEFNLTYIELKIVAANNVTTFPML